MNTDYFTVKSNYSTKYWVRLKLNEQGEIRKFTWGMSDCADNILEASGWLAYVSGPVQVLPPTCLASHFSLPHKVFRTCPEVKINTGTLI